MYLSQRTKCVWGFVCLSLFVAFLSTSLSLMWNSVHFTWVRHSSRKSSATHSCQRLQYLYVSKQWYSCQCLGFLTRTQLMHATAHRGCMDTVRQPALEEDLSPNCSVKADQDHSRQHNLRATITASKYMGIFKYMGTFIYNIWGP